MILESVQPDIWGQVFHYCNLRDLKNLSCTCSAYSDLLKPFIFHTLKVPQKGHIESHLHLRNMHYVQVLTLYDGLIPKYTESCMGKMINLTKLSIRTSKKDLKLCQELYGKERVLVSDKTFDFLCKTLVNLRILHVDMFNLVTNAGLKNIQKLVRLEELSLGSIGMKVDCDGIRYISSLPSLRSLAFRNCQFVFNDGICKALTKLSLVELVISGSNHVSDGGFTHIGTMRSLKKFVFCSDFYQKTDPRADAVLDNVCKISSLPLNEVDLGFMNISDKEVDMVLNNVFMLTKLSLGVVKANNTLVYTMSDISDQCIARLSKLRYLRSLTLRGKMRVTDTGIRSLSGLSTLMDLTLIGMSVTDASLSSLHTLPKLRKLSLIDCKSITDKGLEHISHISGLKHLCVRRCIRITEMGVKAVCELPLLKKLDISECALKYAWLKYISAMLSLEELTVSCVPVSGYAVLADAAGLQKLTLNSGGGTFSKNSPVLNLLRVIPVVENENGENLHHQ